MVNSVKFVIVKKVKLEHSTRQNCDSKSVID
jgi:hypothetical protein